MSGGGNKAAKQARADELARQARITAAVDKINSIFDGKPVTKGEGVATAYDPNQAYYDQEGKAYALPMHGTPTGNDYWTQQLTGKAPASGVNTDAVMELIKAGKLFTGTKDIGPSDRQQLYDDQKKAVYDINKRDIDKQFSIAERGNRFGLARAGLLGGSADVDSNAMLQDRTNDGLIKAGGLGDAAAAELKAADERSRQGLISLAQSGIDTGTAEGLALRGLDASAQNAQGARTGATIGSLFDDLGGAYLFSQIAKGQQAGANMYGQQGSGVSNPRATYGGTSY